GSIITPLKDRISSQILTHYPPDPATAAEITLAEASIDRDVPGVMISDDLRLLIEEVTFAARESELVDQASGVSARVAISALELLASNLERRALRLGESPVHARLCDLHMLLPAITGKVEMVYEGEQQGPEVVARQIIGEAVKKVFERAFPAVGRELGSGGEDDTGPYSEIVAWFAEGNSLTLSDEMPFHEYRAALAGVPGLLELGATYGDGEAATCLGAEIVLEGLHQHLKLARQDLDSQVSYREMVKFQLLKPRRRGPRREDVH
ncbi:MAG: magnesium chelatase, partial [Acidobacteria bacterium]|nr:magnesium chelatase [Acidobacteriota bacterium]